jgi:hypothetical protein
MSLFPKNLNEYLALIGVPRGTNGHIYLVDSVHGSAGAPGTNPAQPLATLAAAIAKCTANHGDVIVLAPKHAETLTAAITVNVAGVTILGLGTGNDRPAFTVNGVVDGISVESDDVTLENVRFPTPSAAATAQLNVAAARATVRKCGFAQGANAVNAVTVTAAGELLTVEDCDVVVSANGPSAWLKFEGVVDRPVVQRNVVLGSDGTNAYDQGALDFNSQAVTNPVVRDNVFLGGGTATTIVANASSVVGSSVGPNVYGGSATGADDVSGESEVLDQLSGASGVPTFPAAAIPANGVSLAEVIRQLYAALEGTATSQNGVATWPTAAAYANNVSIAEVLGYIQDAVRNGSGAAMATNKGIADALGTNGTTVTDSAVSVLGAIGANNADNAFASGSVAANVDGSVLEREEWLQAEMAKVPKGDAAVTWNATALASLQTEAEDALAADNLDHWQKTATADVTDPVDMTAEVVDNSVLAHVLTDDGDVSDYDRRYMSLEALAKLLQIEFGYTLRSVAGSAMPIAVWYVDANIGASGDGKTPATAFKTIAEAITACSNTVDDWVLIYDYSGGETATITIDKAFVHLIGNANPCMPYPRIMPTGAFDGLTLGDAADRVEIANLVIGGGDQTVSAININSAAGAYGVYIHDCVIGRDAAAPALYGIYVPSGSDAPYLTVENNKFYGADGAGIAAAGSAIRIAGNATRCNILGNYIQDVGRTATPAIWLDGSVTNPRIENNRIKTDTDTGTGSAITLGAGVDDGWIAGNLACDGKDAPAQNPYVDGGSTNGWSQNYSGIVAVLPA